MRRYITDRSDFWKDELYKANHLPSEDEARMWLENGDIYWMYVEDDAIRKYVNEALGGGKVLEINNHQAQLINLSAEDEILVIRHYYDESFSTPRVEGKVGSGSHPPYTYDLLQIRSTGRF